MTPYLTTEQASDYFAGHLHAEAWNAATEQKRAAALATAQTLIDALPFNGRITSHSQPNAWPRTGATDHEGRVISAQAIPTQITAACAEWALHLLQNPGQPATTAPIKRRKVGDLQVEYSAATVDPLPPMVRTLLAPFLRTSPNVALIIHG